MWKYSTAISRLVPLFIYWCFKLQSYFFYIFLLVRYICAFFHLSRLKFWMHLNFIDILVLLPKLYNAAQYEQGIMFWDAWAVRVGIKRTLLIECGRWCYKTWRADGGLFVFWPGSNFDSFWVKKYSCIASKKNTYIYKTSQLRNATALLTVFQVMEVFR